MISPFELPGEWLKGNLHCHTTQSDGGVSPEQRVIDFSEHGYDFLAVSDHGLATATVETNHTGLTVIPGAEYHPRNPWSDIGFHLLALGVTQGFPNPAELNMQDAIGAVREAGGIAVVAHPYWCGLTRKELEPLTGFAGIEVFNTTCEASVGKGTSSVHWDDLLAMGRTCWALAVDDCHGVRDAYQGWIMVKAEERSPEAILNAVADGAFYASTGPTIHKAEHTAEGFRVECSEVDYIKFMASGPCGHQVWNEDGSPVTSATWELTNPERATPYVRIECVSRQHGVAWTNPFYYPSFFDPVQNG